MRIKIFKILMVIILLVAAITTCKQEKETTKKPEMVYVEGGTFMMGCTDGDCYNDGRERPAHEVTVNSFYIAKYLVTQEEWDAVMAYNPSPLTGNDLPVESVTWNAAQEYIAKLNAVTGKNYRLPTEAEWEYAARGGNKSKGYKYSGSDDVDAVAWYLTNSGNISHPVGLKMPNELGIYDMSGNVWEWCSDWYDNYSSASQINPIGPSSGSKRVIRGGNYVLWKQAVRVSMRSGWEPNNQNPYLGFRLVLDKK